MILTIFQKNLNIFFVIWKYKRVMKGETMNRLQWIKNILILQIVVVIYTLSSVVAKFATGKELFSLSFF